MWLKFRSQVEKSLQDALKELKISTETLYLEVPPEGFGDLASSICLVLAKELGRKPHTLTKDIQTVIQGRMEGKVDNYPLIEKVEVAGPGYLNFFMELEKSSPKIVGGILKKGKDYGKVDLGKGTKTLVEHTSANPDGPLHIGHLRNSVLGDTIARILRFTGYDVITESYINDCGRLMAITCWEYQKERTAPSGKGDEWVVDIYIRGNRRLEKEGIEDAMRVLREYEKGSHVADFQTLVNAALEGQTETLKKLGITHDEYIWESSFIRDGTVEKLVEKIEKHPKAIKEGKLLALDLSDAGFRKEFMIRRSDGSFLYSAKDLAHHYYYKTSKAKRSINILGSDHKLHYGHMKTALKILGCKEEFDVIHYEFISLPEGQMSTRKGNYISVDDLISETKKRAYEEVKKRRKDLKVKEKEAIADAVAVGALRYVIVSVSPEKPIMFNWDAILDFEKSSAPALQYTFARITRILEKTKKKPCPDFVPTTDSERKLLLHLAKFPGVVAQASENLRPQLITAYASELNNLFKEFYAKCKVIGSKEEPERLALVKATRQTLENILGLLGIPPLEKM